MRKVFLRWPCQVLAILIAGGLCLPSAGGALLDSRAAGGGYPLSSRSGLERELVGSYLEALGYQKKEIDFRLAQLTGEEIHRLAFSHSQLAAGGEEQGKKAAGVALAILITLGLITGFYLFYNAD